jgi:hypothetical protein
LVVVVLGDGSEQFDPKRTPVFLEPVIGEFDSKEAVGTLVDDLPAAMRMVDDHRSSIRSGEACHERCEIQSCSPRFLPQALVR